MGSTSRDSDLGVERAVAPGWRRYSAFFLDAVFLLPLFLLVALVEEAGLAGQIIGAAVGYLALWVYRIVLHARRGATWGKDVMGICVARRDGSSVSWADALRRESVILGLSVLMLTVEIWMIVHYQSSLDTLAEPANRPEISDFRPWWGWLIAIAYVVWLFLDPMFAAFGERGRMAHDLIGDTVVLRTADAEQALAADAPVCRDDLESVGARR